MSNQKAEKYIIKGVKYLKVAEYEEPPLTEEQMKIVADRRINHTITEEQYMKLMEEYTLGLH